MANNNEPEMVLSEEDQEEFEFLQEEFQDFVNLYSPKVNPTDPTTYLLPRESYMSLKKVDEALVWSVVWGEDRVVFQGLYEPDGSGDTVIGYILCDEPFDDDMDQVVFEREFSCAACDGEGCDKCNESGFYLAQCGVPQ